MLTLTELPCLPVWRALRCPAFQSPARGRTGAQHDARQRPLPITLRRVQLLPSRLPESNRAHLPGARRAGRLCSGSTVGAVGHLRNPRSPSGPEGIQRTWSPREGGSGGGSSAFVSWPPPTTPVHPVNRSGDPKSRAWILQKSKAGFRARQCPQVSKRPLGKAWWPGCRVPLTRSAVCPGPRLGASRWVFSLASRLPPTRASGPSEVGREAAWTTEPAPAGRLPGVALAPGRAG